MGFIVEFDSLSNRRIFNVAHHAIVEAGNLSIFLDDIEPNVFIAHFAKPDSNISTSFDLKYNDETEQWQSSLHFRGVKKNKVDMHQYDFPNLNNLLDDDLLPTLIEEEFISDKAFLNESIAEDYYIQSSNPDDIMRLNIILLDILQYKGGRIIIDQHKKQKILDDGPHALPNIADQLIVWQAQRQQRGTVVPFKPPGRDVP